MTMYDFLNSLPNGYGCTGCRFAGDGAACDQGGGYTLMDEHGECPVEGIKTQEDVTKAVYEIPS